MTRETMRHGNEGADKIWRERNQDPITDCTKSNTDLSVYSGASQEGPVAPVDDQRTKQSR